MSNDDFEYTSPKTLWSHVRNVLRARSRYRPVSLFLLFAIMIVALLGVQVIDIRDNPKKFALFLSLNFLFFFVVIWRAIIDCFEILKRSLKDRRDVYDATLGDREFTAELGRRIAEKQEHD
jgi:hypothetical protein